MEPASDNAMNMSIIELVAQENFSSYVVHLDFQLMHVVATHNPDIVRFWISIVRFAIRHISPEYLVVGVWVEWRRNKKRLQQRKQKYPKPDILQLCVGELCLIYQIGHANGNIPQELLEFLGDNKFTFVGLEIQRIVEILNSDYEIEFGKNIVDLNDLFATTQMVEKKYRFREMINSVLGRDYGRPKAVHTSRWDDLVLNQDQVLFASANASICFWIGIFLQAWNLPRI